MLEPVRHRLPVAPPEVAPPERSGLFGRMLAKHELAAPRRSRVSTLQVNVGRRCNLSCRHCHVDAGPNRSESLSQETAERIVELLRASPSVSVLDLTGGAPELCPSFRFLVSQARQQDLAVIDRCNLAILFEPGMEGTAELLASSGVHVIASLPCYTKDNVDRQRGGGAFEASVRGLRLLNALGYARRSELVLDLVYNPVGPSLPPPQESLEHDYRQRLKTDFDIDFDHLLTITNMPIRRFGDALDRSGKRGEYMELLADHFNAATLPGLMCRTLASVDYRGLLYDCDFNQMLGMSLEAGNGRRPLDIWSIRSLDELDGGAIATAEHCLGCTAGAGSSCSGALAMAADARS